MPKPKANIRVVFYSRDGSVEALAKAVSEGACQAGAEVPRRMPEIVSPLVRHRLRASRTPAVTVRLFTRTTLAYQVLILYGDDSGDGITSTRRGTGDGVRGPHDSRLFSNPRYNEISP